MHPLSRRIYLKCKSAFIRLPDQRMTSEHLANEVAKSHHFIILPSSFLIINDYVTSTGAKGLKMFAKNSKNYVVSQKKNITRLEGYAIKNI